jgi:hypothetical protein
MSQSTARYCDSSAAVKPGLSMNILSITNGKLLNGLDLEHGVVKTKQIDKFTTKVSNKLYVHRLTRLKYQ